MEGSSNIQLELLPAPDDVAKTYEVELREIEAANITTPAYSVSARRNELVEGPRAYDSGEHSLLIARHFRSHNTASCARRKELNSAGPDSSTLTLLPL